MTRGVVRAYAEDNGIMFGIAISRVPKATGLSRAARGVIFWVEVEDDRTALQRRKREALSVICQERKVYGR